MYCVKCGLEIKKRVYACPNCNFKINNLKHKWLNYAFFCHRMPERSFFIKGNQFPICARCTGIMIGYIIGIISLFFISYSNIIFSILLILPTGIDGIGQYLGKWKSNNIRRCLTGILAGIGVISIFAIIGSTAIEQGREFKIKYL